MDSTKAWKLGSSSTINWPSSSRGGNGNGGVAQIVKSTPGAIGYVDYADAKASGLTYAVVQNTAGKYIAPSPRRPPRPRPRRQGRAQPDVRRGLVGRRHRLPDHLPVVGPGLPKQPNANTVKMLKAYLGYLLGPGQQLLPALGYAPLPANIDQKAKAQLSKISSLVSTMVHTDRIGSPREHATKADPAGRPDPPRLVERRPLGDRTFQALALAAGLLVLVILVLIAVSTSQQASSWFSTEGIKIFSSTWNPAANQFGALPFIYGTAVTAIIALVMAVPVSVAIALLLTEVVPYRVGAADRVRDRPAGGGPVGGLGPVGDPGVRAVDPAHLRLRSARESTASRCWTRCSGRRQRGLVLHRRHHPGLHDHAHRDLAVA